MILNGKPGLRTVYFSRYFALCAAFLFGTAAVHSQSSTSSETFGQNRVQYKDYIFQYYESDNFNTYFYQGGQDVGKYVIKTAEDVSDEISALLDFKYRRKIDVIVYNNINELNQTNIGIYEPGQNTGGTVKVPEGKLFIYYNGDHRHLDKQIREGIAKIYLDRMTLGTGFAEFVQNAVLLNLPDWYKKGLVQYIGEDWNSDMEDRLRDGILSGRYKRLNKLQPEEAEFVGHSIWHYIEEVHGKSAVSNVIYLTRVDRSVDNGFQFVLGTNLSQTLQDWYVYYYSRFTAEKAATTEQAESTAVKTRIKKDMHYYQLCLSPDGKHIAFARNDMGRYVVYIQNTENNKRKAVYRGGFRTNTQFTDESIPLLAWDPSGKRLAILSDKRAQISLRFYDMQTHKTEINPVRKFQKVVGFSFVDSKQLVMSAVQNGQTDIFLYTIASTTTRKLTDDYFDDLYPAYIVADSIRGIMFSSNRPDADLTPGRYESQNILKTHDLFFYDLNASEAPLYRITNTQFANETYPQNFNEKEYCFLSDETGIRNRYIGHFESVFDRNRKIIRYVDKETNELDSLNVEENVAVDSMVDKTTMTFKDSMLVKTYKIEGITRSQTNYTRGIYQQSVVPEKAIALDLGLKNGKPVFYKYSYEGGSASNAVKTEYVTHLQKLNVEVPENTNKTTVAPITFSEIVFESEEKQQRRDTTPKGKGDRPFDFQSEFDYGVKLFDWDSVSANKITTAQEGYVFRFSRVRPYFVRFMVDKVIAQFDNGIVLNRYQPVGQSAFGEPFGTPNFAIKVGITDLLENHKVYGGMTLPIPFGDTKIYQYFLTYENLTKRLDKKITFYRKSLVDKVFVPIDNSNFGQYSYTVKTNFVDLALTYPIDVLNSIRFNFSFRNDLVLLKATDKFSLDYPRSSDNWLSTRVEYVFDNCMEVATNIRYGTRFKVFGEIYKEFPASNKSLSDNIDFPVPTFNNKYMINFGVDLRHYQKVYKKIIWASRLSAGMSLGNKKLLYYMGGLDSWFRLKNNSSFDYSTPVNFDHGYAFQTLATPLRGFLQNARNGDKYILLNTEIRIPIFATLINSPIKSDFIKNFQLVGFYDVGTAWEGLSPFADNNPLFNEALPNTNNGSPSVIVRVKRYRTPVIMGFGPGVRTTFLGYFMRLDAAWSYDTGEISKKPMYYFTFGLDF